MPGTRKEFWKAKLNPGEIGFLLFDGKSGVNSSIKCHSRIKMALVPEN